jgi:predicted phosphodiesterase
MPNLSVRLDAPLRVQGLSTCPSRMNKLSVRSMSMRHWNLGKRQLSLGQSLPSMKPERRTEDPTLSQSENVRLQRAADVDPFDDVQVPAGLRCRIFILSDVHADHSQNLSWLASHLPTRSEGAFDVCILSGDVSDDLGLLGTTLALLRKRFAEVCFTPGNHDLWMARKPRRARKLYRAAKPGVGGVKYNSVHKLQAIFDLCALHRVRCNPVWLREMPEPESTSATHNSERNSGILLVPLYSWYHSSWDSEPEPAGSSEEGIKDMLRGVSDFHFCQWPDELWPEVDGASDVGQHRRPPADGGNALAAWFASLNEPVLQHLSDTLPPPAEVGRAPPERRLNEEATCRLYSVEKTPRSGFMASLLAKARPRRLSARSTGGDARHSERSTEVDDGALAELGFESIPAGVGRPFVVSFSHFVPRQELIYGKGLLSHGGLLPRISGSTFLENQIRRLMPDIHIFGHTHINADVTIEGVRYVQWALGNPREQEHATRLAAQGFMCVFDGTRDGEAPQHWSALCEHYEHTIRATKVHVPVA